MNATNMAVPGKLSHTSPGFRWLNRRYLLLPLAGTAVVAAPL